MRIGAYGDDFAAKLPETNKELPLRQKTDTAIHAAGVHFQTLAFFHQGLQNRIDNFGMLGTDATKEDLSLGIINMVFQTIGMLSAFALRNDDIKDVVLIGALASLPHGRQILDAIEEISDVRFFVPDEAPFGTAIGAALPYTKA